MVIFAPAGYAAETMAGHVEWARESMARHLAPPGEAVETTGAVV